MACYVADLPPAADTPHGCPGAVIIGSGADVQTRLCECPICWPNGPPPMPPPPVFGRVDDGSPLG